MRHSKRRGVALAFALLGGGAAFAQELPHPILFVTQFPIPGDFTAIGSVFGNHRGTIDVAGRGGDLYVRYPNGVLRNLTQEAGYGNAGMQGATSIAVRDPAVSWDGTKAVFSMVIGAPPQQFVWQESYFQLYEITGLGVGQQPVIVKLPHQPANYNNVSPAYLSDGSIVFVSDRPRNGARHLYPQLDEYEEAPTPTGLWRLDPVAGKLDLLQYSVSGSFNPIVDSYGRVLFTRWDHLQRDQQNDNPGNPYGIFNWSNESAASTPTPDRTEVFPEPRAAGGGVNGFTINHFFPWMVNQDGTEEETLNHVGRHELHSYFNRSFNEAGLTEFIAPPRSNILNFLQMREDPTTPGRYVGVDAPEFYTHASGQIVRMDATAATNAAAMTVTYLNPRSSTGFYEGTAADPVPADFTGHYRNPLPLSDGRMIAAHTSESRIAGNDGTRANPNARYQFRLKRLAVGAGGYLAPVENLTPGITKSVSYWDPDVLVSYNGPLWELSPVEVRARTVPPATAFALKTPEQNAFVQEGVDVDAFRAYLRANGLALAVMRDVTTRDKADRQQPVSLRVPGGAQTLGGGGAVVHDISYMQFFQGDQIRGKGGTSDPADGRRVLAQVMHDGPTLAANAPNPGGPAGSVPIAADGSVALFVPALRALAWQSTGPSGTPVVRERYWITFQPGEIRACDGCHGVNQQNQASQPAASNTSTALRALLARWKNGQVDLIFANGVEVR